MKSNRLFSDLSHFHLGVSDGSSTTETDHEIPRHGWRKNAGFYCLIVLTAIAAFGLACLSSDNAMANSAAPALLCHQCSFGSNGTKCIKCGSYWGKVPAVLCNQCSFGSNGNKCVKCGSPWGKNCALLCNNCAFGSNARKCLKCGKYCQ